MGITLQEFEIMCQKQQLYTGFVEDLGYVYWVSRYVISPNTSSSNSFCSSQPTISTPFYELIVIKSEENENRGLEPLTGLINTGKDALSLYGIVNSFEQLSTKPVIIGEKYIQINPQGTLVRNSNRVFTTKGKIAAGIGRKIFIAGIIVDTTLWATGEQSFSEAAINVGVNTGIYIIGGVCPPVGIVLGILWFITSCSKRVHITAESYREIHGSVTPADATRVVIPQHYSPIMRYRPSSSSKHFLKQGK